MQGTVPQHQFKVLVKNEVNRTYFTGPAWRAFVRRYAYAMEPGKHFILWLEEGDNSIISDFPDLDAGVNSSEMELSDRYSCNNASSS